MSTTKFSVGDEIKDGDDYIYTVMYIVDQNRYVIYNKKLLSSFILSPVNFVLYRSFKSILEAEIGPVPYIPYNRENVEKAIKERLLKLLYTEELENSV